jgi:putative DNA methylase
MTFHRRKLPHLYVVEQPVFITWCLRGSFPVGRGFPEDGLTSGEAFAAFDRLLDETREGTRYLAQPRIADMVVEAIQYNSAMLKHYQVHAFLVMPNHVHLLVTPSIALPKLTRSLKGITAKRANEMLGLTGSPFWQDESYDRLLRNQAELDRVRKYIELNPVRAGLVSEAAEYRWSSGWAAGGPPAGQGACPTLP